MYIVDVHVCTTILFIVKINEWNVVCGTINTKEWYNNVLTQIRKEWLSIGYLLFTLVYSDNSTNNNTSLIAIP